MYSPMFQMFFNNLYKFCVQYSDTELCSIWDCKTDISEHDAKTMFKKLIDKHNITKKDYETLMYEPKKYKKKKTNPRQQEEYCFAQYGTLTFLLSPNDIQRQRRIGCFQIFEALFRK